MRILHLIDAVSPQASSTTLAMLADAQGRLGHITDRVALLGGSHLSGQAAEAGVIDPIRIGVPLGRAVLGWSALRRELQRRGEAPFDLIHCWSIGALTLATLMFRSVPRLLTLTVAPTTRHVRWLRAITGQATGGAARAVLLPISSTIRRDLMSGGIGESDAHVLRPGIDMSRIVARGRDSLRRRWGIAPQDDAKIVAVHLLSDPPTAADAVAGMVITRFAMETLLLEGIDVRLVLHPFQRRRLQAKSMLRHIDGLRLLIDEPGVAQPWTVLPGCDISLALGTHGPVRTQGVEARALASQRPVTKEIGHGYLGAGGSAESGGGGLSLLWAMAANIPIVGEATYANCEIVEDRHSALLAKPGQFRTLAHHVKQTILDKHLAWQLRDTARHEAYSFFSRARYCQSIRGVYEQMVEGKPIKVPEMEATGGLRFAGRA
jgi:hypothetical protein